jgi:predicted metalloprotease with PDZ domain
MAWFTEGFTTYYQDVLLLRARMLSFAQYVDRTNEKIRKYLLSPAKNISNEEIVSRSQTDSAISELPYSRGAITALWLDWQIRERTRGKASLDTVMLDLVRTSRGTNPPLTEDRILRAVGQYVDAGTLQPLRDDVELGKTISIPAAALGPCVTLQRDDIPAFELGFDREALLGQHIVSGLQPESAAFQAGLREGQPVTEMSIYWNDVSKPVKLTVRTENGSKTIEYYPRGPSRGLIPQYHLNVEAPTSQNQCGS